MTTEAEGYTRRACRNKLTPCPPANESRCGICPPAFPSLALAKERYISVPKPTMRQLRSGVWTCHDIGYGQDAEDAYNQWRTEIMRRLTKRGLKPDRPL